MSESDDGTFQPMPRSDTASSLSSVRSASPRPLLIQYKRRDRQQPPANSSNMLSSTTSSPATERLESPLPISQTSSDLTPTRRLFPIFSPQPVPRKNSSFLDDLNTPIKPSPSSSSYQGKQNKAIDEPVLSPAKRPKLVQAYLDLGQKSFAPRPCKDCSMMYCRGLPDDEKAHKHEHERILRGIEFRAKLKPAELVKRAPSGTVVAMIAPDDARFGAKIREVLEIVNRDLGFIADGDLAPHNHKIFLAIHDSRVVGCVVAEAIRTAFPVNVTKGVTTIDTSRSRSAVCGINRIWTLKAKRRCGVATLMLDAVRCVVFVKTTPFTSC